VKTRMVPPVDISKSEATVLPHLFIEYTCYACVFYANLGLAWGLMVPSLGGTMLVVLAVACLISVRSRPQVVWAPIGFALSCGISVIALQLALHDTDPLGETRPFIDWLLLLLIVQALTLRPGFLHRFAFAAFGMGLCSLTFVEFRDSGDIVRGDIARAVAYGTGLANPNVLSLWFGFCFLYFLVFGLEARRIVLRAASWLTAFGCLYVISITVSRGPLVGVAVASLFAFRHALKDSFKPLLFFAVLSFAVYESGVFDRVTDFYLARGMEETGRGILWPLAFQRFLDSPWEGVGLAQIEIPFGGRLVGPHNGILYIALASGVIPAAFFLAYLFRAGMGAFRRDAERFPDARFLQPLVAFAFLTVMTGDAAFMIAWPVVVLALAVSGYRPPRSHQIAVARMRMTGTEQLWNRPAGGVGS
jgi:hypothetical protein